jgi:hypothetical protein
MSNNMNNKVNFKLKTGSESHASLTPGAVMIVSAILSAKQKNEVTKITRRLKNSLNF